MKYMKILLASTLPVLAILSFAWLLATAPGFPTPAQAQDLEEHQCLSREECRELRATLKQFKRQIRPLRRELRQLRQRIRETPEGEERDQMIQQARRMKRELRELRHERRPTLKKARHGCRRECFPV